VSWANAISADGSAIVGAVGFPVQTQAFRWTQATGMVGLGDLSGGDVYSAAYDISDNGAVVVGSSSSSGSTSGRAAFRLDQALGMVGLGFLPTKAATSDALSVTPDGSVIVGSSGANGDAAAFVWDAAHGMRSLQSLISADPNLVGNLTGWKLQLASAISAD